MKLVGLISGGKDSLYNMHQCISAGHTIVALANIEPESEGELDSYMYQSVGHEAIALIAGALNLPIFRHKTKGKAICRNKTYTGTTLDEVEDLYALLSKVKKNVEIEGVSVGAIASDYQRTRVENVCLRLGLKCFAYLWRRDQSELLQEMIEANVDAIFIKVASIGLHPEVHLGMHIKDALPYLFELNRKFGVNICGEGGEYETLTLDCPLFHRFIEISESESVVLSDDAFAPVGALNVKNATLKSKGWKSEDPVLSSRERLKYIKAHIKDPYAFVEDCVDEITQNLFPQKPTKKKPDIPFPFEDGRKDSISLSTNLQEYWKKSQSKKSASQSSVKLTASGSVNLSETSRSSLSYISGWCCISNITGASIQDALSCLQKNLERTTYSTVDIVFVNVYTRNMSDFANMNKVYSQFMPEVLPPARSCVGTLLPPEIGYLLHVVAHKVLSKSQKAVHALTNQERDAMHVQSISHWAPANIGPYSQCVKIGGLYYLSGQIPLIPGTMEILNKPIFHQCRLTIRHLQRVLQAMDENLCCLNIFHAVCYVTAQEFAPDLSEIWNYVTSATHTTVAVIVVTELPRNAQIEWEVVACSYENPEVDVRNEIMDDFNLQMRRCYYEDPFAASIICRVTYLRKSKTAEKVLKVITPKLVQDFMKVTHEFLKSGSKIFAMPLCMLKLYYKPFDNSTAFSMYDFNNLFFDTKVVCTAIPVVAFNNPDVIITITGVCH